MNSQALTKKKTQPEDIVDALEARGDDLSRRAARYIRIKRTMLAGREAEIRHMAKAHLEEQA